MARRDLSFGEIAKEIISEASEIIRKKRDEQF